jgi:hypothetical protein
MTAAQILLLISQALGDIVLLQGLIRRIIDQFDPNTVIEISDIGDEAQAALDRIRASQEV